MISEKLKHDPSNRWQEKISVSSKAKNLSDITEDKQLKKKNYGILVHDILSRIRQPEEVEKAVQAVIYEGVISEKEKEILVKQIEELLGMNEIAAFFDTSWKFMNEREIILPDGRLLRPDRVIYNNTETKIIDFKTGKKQKSHADQVNEYGDTLAQMAYPGIRKFLVYITEKEVVEIT